MDAELIARVERLEEKLAFQERTSDDLNDVIARQADQIDALARKLSALRDQVDEMEDTVVRAAPVAKPPHY